MKTYLLGKAVVLKRHCGDEIRGTLIGIATEPSYILEEDGRRFVYSVNVVRDIEEQT